MKNITTIGRSISAAGVTLLGIPTLQNQFAAITLIPPEQMRWFILSGLVMMVAGPVIAAFGGNNDPK